MQCVNDTILSVIRLKYFFNFINKFIDLNRNYTNKQSKEFMLLKDIKDKFMRAKFMVFSKKS